MEWFNPFGLIFMIIIMIPNIIFAVRNKAGFENKFKNRPLEVIEQAGRIGCFVFMIFNIPKTGFGFRSGGAFVAYLLVNAALVLTYCALWIALRKKRSVFRALSLSVLPSAIFLFSGLTSHSWPLTISAFLLAPAHILISFKNAD